MAWSPKAWTGSTQTVQAHFDRSNFAVEMHQAFLDLVTVGNATLLFEEAPVGRSSAFRLTAVPLSEIAFEAGPDGHIDGHFRERSLPLDVLRARFPGTELPPAVDRELRGSDAERSVTVVEAVLPSDGGFAYFALLADQPVAPGGAGDRPLQLLAVHQLPLAEGRGRDLRPLAGDGHPAGHQDRQQGGRADPEERVDRGHRDLAGGR